MSTCWNIMIQHSMITSWYAIWIPTWYYSSQNFWPASGLLQCVYIYNFRPASGLLQCVYILQICKHWRRPKAGWKWLSHLMNTLQWEFVLPLLVMSFQPLGFGIHGLYASLCLDFRMRLISAANKHTQKSLKIIMKSDIWIERTNWYWSFM